ncbi:XdhC family protein, partial [Microbacterium sp.]|uniref:XdhC family protein n=1 Tax=Microbacterium sp. TaxID=51671 RepID=UPI0025FA42D3
MRDILPIAAEWARAGRSFALATVVGVTGSAPREIGASMVVSADGEVFGSVSGGCVESAVYERSLEVVDSGIACVERFGYSDADAFAVGLTCGGVIDVLVRAVPVGSAPAADLVLLAERETRAVATAFTLVTSGPDLGRGWLDADPSDDADSVTVHVGTPARLIIVGAVEFAVALSRLAVAVGMRVSVVDPRSVFATAERFPGAEVVVAWPDRYLASQRLDGHTAVCVLSHDPKFDVPALCTALASPAGYVGAMGSRRTHEDRRRRLIQAGVPPTGLERLRSPIGLDLGGRTPEETALSILAEIIADRHG